MLPHHTSHHKTNISAYLRTGYVALVLIFLSLSYGCRKFVDIDPPASRITASATYNNNSSAAAVMSGVYSNMIGLPALSSGSASVSLLEGLAADELTNYYAAGTPYVQFYKNALTSSTAGASNSYFWKEIYQEIHVANALIEGLVGSAGVSSSVKQQLDGEAKFIRAFYHFYAVNIYGDVPLVTTSDYLTNNSIGRTPKAQVYQQIIKDLTEAKAELSNNFVDPYGAVTTERTRPNKGAAAALLARVYLYTGNWPNAESEADSIIKNGNYTLLKDLGQVFKKNSMESIWQLPSVLSGYNTWDAQYFVLTAPPGTATFPVALSNNLVTAFEPNDSRFSKWVNVFKQNSSTLFYYPYKYQAYKIGDPLSEYLTVFRLAEQYLIRAEARANGAGAGLNGAVADLDTIRIRANLPIYTGTMDKASVLNAILHERQVELFTEWGHRWFDLIRTGNITTVMGSPGNVCQAKGGVWNADWVLAPIPLSEILINPNLNQNHGYN